MRSCRRLLALLTMFVTLHLTFVGANVACAEAGQAGAMAGMSHAPASDAATGHHADHPGAPAPCDTPASAHCCDAVASCGVVALGATTGATGRIVVAEGVFTPATQHLISRTLAPEPPPPRA